MFKFKHIFYAITILLLVIPIIPLPFSLPFLSEIFGGHIGILLIIFIALTVVIFELLALVYLFNELFFSRKTYKLFVLEIIIFPIITLWLVWINFELIDSQIDFIYWINENRQIENFHNPFLGFQMRDCRKFTGSFDVIFIPRHLSIETDYLTYASKRNPENKYTNSKELNNNWYIENSGSMWSDNLRKCYFQGNIPY